MSLHDNMISDLISKADSRKNLKNQKSQNTKDINKKGSIDEEKGAFMKCLTYLSMNNPLFTPDTDYITILPKYKEAV